MAAGIITLTDTTFDEVIKGSDTPILVDFWADWCGPCKQMNPILEEIAEEQKGQLTIAKLDVQAFGDIAGRHDVMSIPAFLLFVNGEVVWEHRSGAMRKSRMLEELNPFLPASQ